MSVEKIAAIKAKRLAKKRQTIKTDDDIDRVAVSSKYYIVSVCAYVCVCVSHKYCIVSVLCMNVCLSVSVCVHMHGCLVSEYNYDQSYFIDVTIFRLIVFLMYNIMFYVY